MHGKTALAGRIAGLIRVLPLRLKNSPPKAAPDLGGHGLGHDISSVRFILVGRDLAPVKMQDSISFPNDSALTTSGQRSQPGTETGISLTSLRSRLRHTGE